MKKTIGLIDFGSNTFHLLIAQMTAGGISIIFRKRAYVFLAQAGVSVIAEEAMERGFQAVEDFYKFCRQFKTEEIIAVGTAALRSANNSGVFIKTILEKYGIQTKVVSGDREADLIYKGMSLACPAKKQNALFMDIGGGSTEFILTNDDQIIAQESLPLGLGVLSTHFSLSDPVTPQEIEEMYNFINHSASFLIKNLWKYKPKILIGGSGTFDVLAYALTGEAFKSQDCCQIDTSTVKSFIEPLIYTTLKEREANGQIPKERVRLIVHAFLLIQWLMNQYAFEKIAFSKFALKEGLLQEHYAHWKSTL